MEAGNLMRGFKNKDDANIYSLVKVQRLVTVMTVIDSIYGVKAQFKSSNENDRKIDKLLMKFFLIIMEEAKKGKEQNICSLDCMREAERLYLRISNMFK